VSGYVALVDLDDEALVGFVPRVPPGSDIAQRLGDASVAAGGRCGDGVATVSDDGEG